MRITERFTRTGNEILYEVTVEDPEVLLAPRVLHPRTMVMSGNGTIIAERGACADTELAEVSPQQRH